MTDTATTSHVELERPIPTGAALTRALVVGSVLSAVLGWTLLSLALSLLFMLGLFFYLLFGLIIGACMYRVAAGARPIPRGKVIAVTAAVSVVCWASSLVKECIDYPRDFVTAAMKKVHVPSREYERVEAELAVFIERHLREVYPPGGALGYLQLAAQGKSITVDLPGQPRPVRIPPRAAAWVWWARVVLALAFAYVATFAVTVDLTRPAKVAVHAPRAKGD